MGGNVFKQGQTRRYESGEYFELVEKIKPILESLSNRFEVIPAYKSKESFGDMDILIIPRKEWSKSLLDLTFNSGGDVIHNGGVWSLVFEQIQVDLITTSEQEFNASLDYFGK
jgi:DNA polymerase/3'-5' exonuclease PolX